MGYLYNDINQKGLRKNLRNTSGLPEIILWNQLKQNKLGKKFRRQYSIGHYVLDFYCPELRFGIELDGSTHDNQQSYAYDQQRNKFIKGQNIKITHFQNKDVLNNLNSIIAEIEKLLN